MAAWAARRGLWLQTPQAATAGHPAEDPLGMPNPVPGASVNLRAQSLLKRETNMGRLNTTRQQPSTEIRHAVNPSEQRQKIKITPKSKCIDIPLLFLNMGLFGRQALRTRMSMPPFLRAFHLGHGWISMD